MNKAERRDRNRKAYERRLKKWMSEDGGTFWGRRPTPEGRDKAESWKELKAHGGGIWKLKRNGGGWHGPDRVKRAEIKQTNKRLRQTPIVPED